MWIKWFNDTSWVHADVSLSQVEPRWSPGGEPGKETRLLRLNVTQEMRRTKSAVPAATRVELVEQMEPEHENLDTNRNQQHRQNWNTFFQL